VTETRPTIIGIAPSATNEDDPERPGHKLPWTGLPVWQKIEKPLGIGRGELGRFFRLTNCLDHVPVEHAHPRDGSQPSTEELLAGFHRIIASGTEFILMWSRLQALVGWAYQPVDEVAVLITAVRR
jgi:hypothetical protein